MALSEGIQQKLEQEGVTEASAREFFNDLQSIGAISEEVTFDNNSIREATMLCLLDDKLTDDDELAQLTEVGLNSSKIRSQFMELTFMEEAFKESFK